MSWDKTSFSNMLMLEETITLMESASSSLSSAILPDDISIDPSREHRYATFVADLSAQGAGSVALSLCGSENDDEVATAGAVSADLVALKTLTYTSSADPEVNIVDLNAYPAPNYYIKATSASNTDADKTIKLKVFG
jgi:hypothetical protein